MTAARLSIAALVGLAALLCPAIGFGAAGRSLPGGRRRRRAWSSPPITGPPRSSPRRCA